MKCRLCGDEKGRIINSNKYGIVCSKCYQRENRNNKIYPLPNYGELQVTDDGKYICHICGKAFNKVLTHACQVHKISAYDYKKQFGLETTKGILSKSSKDIASKRNKENYKNVVLKNLIDKGQKTRFKNGSKGRPRNMVSEYTRRNLIARIKEIRLNR